LSRERRSPSDWSLGWENEVKRVIVQNILESMPIGLIVIDPQGEIIATNAAVARSLGYAQEELRNKMWAELFFEREENEAFNQILVDVIMSRKINLHQKVPYVKPNGQQLQLSITSSFLRDRQETIGIVMLIDDITELHRLHESEKKALEERTRLQQERVQSLNHFAMSVAHQIRNPLVSMGGFADRMLKNMDHRQPFMAYLESILSGIKRLEAIVLAVEDYTSISHRERTPTSLEEIVDQVRSDLDMKASALKKRINWTIQLQGKDVSLDYNRFVQALSALLLNALESFTSEEGSIEILAQKEDGPLMLEIIDSGAGIKEENQPFIFDPFFTTKAVGVGMGLCKAQRIIADEHGTIHIESKPDRGTKVNIMIPMDR
jgi:PAS domain S-box-containing protein